MNNYFNFKNFSKTTKIIFFLSLFVISFTAFEIVTLDAHHGTVTKSFGAGTNIISFRDISNTDPTTSTIEGVVNAGQDIEITVTDVDADLDTTVADVVLSSATSTTSGTTFATTTLTETDVNSGIFTGTITLSSSTTSGSTLQAGTFDEFSLFYEPHELSSTSEQEFQEEGSSLGWPRAQASVQLSSGGDVTISDFEIDDNELVNLCFRPVTHAAEILFSNGAAQTLGTDMQVTISYANGVFLSGDNPALLKMYYREPGQGFEIVRDNFNSLGLNTGAKTITSVPDQAVFIGDVTEGQFVLGFETGCGGGGGGGLVRPSLVVNVLVGAGIFASGGGADFSAPTASLGSFATNKNFEMPDEIRTIVENHNPSVPIKPIDPTLFEGFDFPLTINYNPYNGYPLGGYENTLETNYIKVGTPTTLTFTFYEQTEIQHFSFYTNLYGTLTAIHQSDTQFLYNKDKPIEIIDPHELFTDVNITVNELNGTKKQVVLEFTPTKPTEVNDFIVRAWDPNLHSMDMIVRDAYQIISNEEPLFEENVPQPEIEQLQSTHVPIWIKNNAAWWSQELIDDSDFVAGIEYLIQNKIISIHDNQVIADSNYQQIPEWIKNNAGWWSENLITEKEFIDGLQWLISNGIIQVSKT